jgi:hypothetical protein
MLSIEMAKYGIVNFHMQFYVTNFRSKNYFLVIKQ